MSKADEMLSDLSGWSALDLDNPALGLIRGEQQSQIKEMNADMRQLFMDTELGRRVLTHLMNWTVKRPAINPHGNERLDVWRGGQDDIVRCILAACRNSENGDKI